MKHIFAVGISLLFILLCSFSLSAQKLRVYRVTITDTQGASTSYYCGGFTDSSILLYNNTTPFKLNVGSRPMPMSVSFADIGKIVFKAKHRTWHGLATGVTIGGSVGAVAGLIHGGNDSHGATGSSMPGGLPPVGRRIPTEVYMVSLSLAGAVVGALTGPIIGSFSRKTFEINGSHEKFMEMKKR